MGLASFYDPSTESGIGLILHLKDWLSDEFTFLTNSHTLGMNERKENLMTSIALVLLFVVRLVVPFTLLITLGEWARRREIKYWFQI